MLRASRANKLQFVSQYRFVVALVDMNNRTSRQFGTNRVTPGEAIRSYICSRTANQTKSFEVSRILISFVFPAALPLAILLQHWGPPPGVILGLCFGSLFCAILLNSVARTYDAKEMERNYKSGRIFTNRWTEPPSTLRANIEFCILCALACSILFVPVGIYADTFTRIISIMGGGYLFVVLLLGILQIGWRALPLVPIRARAHI